MILMKRLGEYVAKGDIMFYYDNLDPHIQKDSFGKTFKYPDSNKTYLNMNNKNININTMSGLSTCLFDYVHEYVQMVDDIKSYSDSLPNNDRNIPNTKPKEGEYIVEPKLLQHVFD